MFLTSTIHYCIPYFTFPNKPFRIQYNQLHQSVLWIRNYIFIYFFLNPDPTLTLISDPDSDPDCLGKYIWNADHLNIAKQQIFFICTFLDQDCLEKLIWTADHLNIAKMHIFFKSVHFYSFVFVSWKQNLTWIRMHNTVINTMIPV